MCFPEALAARLLRLESSARHTTHRTCCGSSGHGHQGPEGPVLMSSVSLRVFFVLFHFQNEVNSVCPSRFSIHPVHCCSPGLGPFLELWLPWEDPSESKRRRKQLGVSSRTPPLPRGGPGGSERQCNSDCPWSPGEHCASWLQRMKPEPWPRCPWCALGLPCSPSCCFPLASHCHLVSQVRIFLSASANRVGLQCTGCSQLSPQHTVSESA